MPDSPTLIQVKLVILDIYFLINKFDVFINKNANV